MKILYIDDDVAICQFFSLLLKKNGHQITTVPLGRQGVDLLKHEPFDIIITDLQLPDIDGKAVVQQAKQIAPDSEVVVVTGFGSVARAVEIMQLGGYDFWEKPVHAATILQKINKIAEKKALEKENRDLKKRYQELSLEVAQKYQNIAGCSQQLRKIFTLIETVKDLDSTVLITGETGTGKEVIARAIHYGGKRKERPFVAVDCSAIPETLLESELFGYERGAFTSAVKSKTGRFERANTGTLFLDEISNAPLTVQNKLLRVLQDHVFEKLGGERQLAVNVRVIAATNQDLSKAIEEGKFRSDLYYRLNVISIHVPALRERKEDILSLTSHFLAVLGQQLGKTNMEISAACLQRMMQYAWPGNVRELKNLLERAMAVSAGSVIDSIDIPLQEMQPPVATQLDIAKSLPDLLQDVVWKTEKEYLIRLLDLYQGKLSEVARHSGLSPKTLYRKMQEHGLQKEYFKKNRPEDDRS